MTNVYSRDKDPSQCQIGFMGTLPSDVIPDVFSYLTREDCLTCMEVCRAWYQLVPQYSQKLWETIEVTSFDVGSVNRCLERCLGDHVKNVIFYGFDKEEHLYYMMQKVLDWGCTKIKSLEFKCCKTVDQDTFLQLLKRMATQLTRIKMMKHDSNIAFLYVFHACPHLTDFTFQIDARGQAYTEYGAYNTEPAVVRIPPPPPDFSTHITHLCLDIMMDKELRLGPILKRCPELLSFAGASWSARPLRFTPDYNDISVHLGTLFSWCPKITFLESNCSYNYHDDLQDVYRYEDGGLRHFSVCEDYGQEQLAGYLTRHQETLEFVSLWRYNRTFEGLNWSPVFRSLQLTSLQTLICYDILFDAVSVVAMLNHCPALETLVLEGEPLAFSSSAIQSLSTMQKLRSLKCFRIELDDELSLLTVLKRLPALEKLTMISPFMPVRIPQDVVSPKQLKYVEMSPVAWKVDAGNSDVEEAVARLFQCLMSGSKIEVIRLNGVPRLGYKVLLVVANIPTLKTLDMQLDETLESQKESEDACQSALLLRNTSIERLTLRSVRDLSFMVLDKLSDLPFLTQINVTRPRHPHMPCTRIHAEGLIAMLRKSKRLEKACFSACSIEEEYEESLNFSELVERVKGVPGFIVRSGYETHEAIAPYRLIICELTIDRRNQRV